VTPAPGRRPPVPIRAAAGLAAGLILLDVLLNVPRFSSAAPAASILAPSIDLLVLVACGMGIARAGTTARVGLRAAFAVLTAGFAVCEAGLRFGWDAGAQLFGPGHLLAVASWAVVALTAITAGAGAFALCGMLVRGMESALARAVVLLGVSLAAVLQVASGRHLFAPSVIPKLISLIR